MSDFQPPKPGPPHELLQPFVGRFRSVVQLWFGPGDPMVMTGLMINTFQMDGLWLFQDYQGDATDGPFPGFCGKGYWGWNFVTKKYEGFWIDSSSPGMQTETGDVDDAGKLWTMISYHTNPQTGDPMTKRTEIAIQDHDHHSLTAFFCGQDGNDFKNMHIEYTRE